MVKLTVNLAKKKERKGEKKGREKEKKKSRPETHGCCEAWLSQTATSSSLSLT